MLLLLALLVFLLVLLDLLVLVLGVVLVGDVAGLVLLSFLFLFVVQVLGLGGAASGALPAAELGALRDIYRQTGGPSWTGEVAQQWHNTSSPGWDPCGGTFSETGVACADNGTAVVKLKLAGGNLLGTIPAASLCKLTKLTVLRLYSNPHLAPVAESSGDRRRELRPHRR